MAKEEQQNWIWLIWTELKKLVVNKLRNADVLFKFNIG
jgi:superoxide dismutase